MLEVDGFILTETLYGETSKIIHVLTKDYGVIGVMCKGVNSMKSVQRAVTLKYTCAHFVIYYKKDKLSILKSADVIDPLKKIRGDLLLISVLTYISELTYQVMKQSLGKDVYENFVETVLKLEAGLDPVVLVNILEIKYLKELGVLFNLDECVMCGNKTSIVAISSDKGGYICQNCYTNEVLASKKIIQMLRMYYYVNIKSITDLKIDKDTKKMIHLFLEDYYERYTGLYLNSKKFLKTMLDFD